jgi:hypothetical protein
VFQNESEAILFQAHPTFGRSRRGISVAIPLWTKRSAGAGPHRWPVLLTICETKILERNPLLQANQSQTREFGQNINNSAQQLVTGGNISIKK